MSAVVTTRHDEWLQCDRCDFWYSPPFKFRGAVCGDVSWVPLTFDVSAWAGHQRLFDNLLPCKGRVWPAAWMRRRPPKAIADERFQVLMAAHLWLEWSTRAS